MTQSLFRMRSLALPAALLCLALASNAGCGSGSSTSHTGSTPGATSDSTSGAVAAGPDSAELAAALDIQPIEAPALLDSVRASGSQAVLVNVWASWCIPCRQEFPDLLALEQRLRDRGFRLVFVSADDKNSLEDARQFLVSQGITRRSFLMSGSEQNFIDTLSPKWSGALPASFVYDHEGKLESSWEGREPLDVMEKRILEALGSS